MSKVSKAFCIWVLIFLYSSNCKNVLGVDVDRSANALSSFGNILNIGMGGGRPQFYIVDGEIKGVDMQTVKLLSKKMGFQYNIMNDPAMTGEQAIEMVREYIIHTKARVMYSTIQAYNGSCDIGFTTASQTHRRFVKIDFLSATGVYEFIFVGSLPKEVAEFQNLWLPFDNITWISILASAMAVSAALFLMETVWSRNIRDQTIGHRNDAVWVTLSLVVEGHLPVEWFNRSAFKARKFLLFQWIIFCLVMTTGYRSILASLIMKPVLSSPINTAQDMLMSDSKLIIPVPTTIDTLLKSDPREPFQQLNASHVKMKIKTFFSPATKESIATGKMTAILTKSGYPGEYHYGRDTLFSAHTSSAVVPKGSHLKDMFDENISWLRDTGIIDKMVEDERRSAVVHSTSIASENQPLNIMRLSPAFALWSCGILASLLVFCLEARKEI